ncbi:MAG: hypothetical protein ABWX92_07335 [Mycetocola sp.]
MSEFASKWPDMKLWAITRAKTATAVKVSADRDDALPTQVVVSVVPAQPETSVSRFFLVTAECWAASKAAGYALAMDVGFAIESAPRTGSPVVRTDSPTGPNEDRDEAGMYFYSVTVPVVAHRLP